MATILPVSSILLITGFGLALIGLCGILIHRHLLRIIICFALFGTGLHIVIVATGYVTGGTAPIIDRALSQAEAGRAIDPIPSALVVTAIVIGFAVTAIMLAYAVRLHSARKTFDIGAFTESKW
jgi:multisubunit Na+/H+ antiporter MnhC subunit